MNSCLVLIMLWSECSFIRHTNKIVILKTQICVFRPTAPGEDGGGDSYLCLNSHLVGLWLEFQTQLGACSGSVGWRHRTVGDGTERDS